MDGLAPFRRSYRGGYIGIITQRILEQNEFELFLIAMLQFQLSGSFFVVHEQFDGEDDQGCPDNAEADEAGLAKSLMVNKDADKKLNRWRNVLQNPYKIERDEACTRGKEQKRYGRCHASKPQ